MKWLLRFKAALFLVVTAIVICNLGPQVSFAQYEFSESNEPLESPQNFAWEFRVGTYKPDIRGNAFKNVFGNEEEVLIGTEFDFLPLHIPYVGAFGLGASFGWTRFNANSFTNTGERSGEATVLELFPLSALAVLRIDGLARELEIPLYFTGKFGGEFIPWTSKTGSTQEGGDVSIGIRWAAQVGLELDFIEPVYARHLDEDWGLNHTFVYGEVYGSHIFESVPLGDLTWVVGIGMLF